MSTLVTNPILRKILQFGLRIETMWRGFPGFKIRIIWLVATLPVAIYLAVPTYQNLLKLWTAHAVVPHLPWNALVVVLTMREWIEGVAGSASFINTILSIYLTVMSVKKYTRNEGRKIVPMSEKTTIKFGHPIAFSELKPSLMEDRLGFVNRHNPLCRTDNYLRSENFDNSLMVLSKWKFVKSNSRKWKLFLQEPAAKKQQIEFMLPKVWSASMPTVNELKCGVVVPDGGLREQFEIYKLGYMDSILTNEAFRSALYTMKHSAKVSTGNNMTLQFPADQTEQEAALGQAHLMTLSQCRQVGNHIGITALVITKGGRVAILRQGKTLMEAHALNTGGSGSLDWHDIENSSAGDDLRKAVAYSMAREFFEEATLKPSLFKVQYSGQAIMKLMDNLVVTGFFRWIDRCGKPEFVGVMRFDHPFECIKPKNVEVTRYDVELPLIKSLEDVAPFHHALCAHVSENHKRKLSTGSYVAIERLIEIAGYANSADPEKLQIYNQVSKCMNGH